MIDLILLAPAIQQGKEILYLWDFRFEGNGAIEHALVQLTPAEDRESTMTMMKQIAEFGTLIFFVAAPYYVLTESSALRGTLGKRLLGLRVTGLNGNRIGIGRATVRYLVRLVSATPWQLGFAMAGFTARKQALHDLLARTLVVSTGWDREEEKSGAAALRPAACSACSAPLISDAMFCSRCGARASSRPVLIRYAGFGRRLGAVLLDIALLTPILVIWIRLVPPVSPTEFHGIQAYMSGVQLAAREREDLYAAIILRFFQLHGVMFCISGVYCALLESSALQGTLGKRIMGLRVTDIEGRRIRFGRAVGRWLARPLSAALWFVGFLMAPVMPKRQTLHDVLAGTLVVVPESKSPAANVNSAYPG